MLNSDIDPAAVIKFFFEVVFLDDFIGDVDLGELGEDPLGISFYAGRQDFEEGDEVTLIWVGRDADGLLIPIQCEYYGLEGLAKIVDLHERICAAGVNPHVTIEGILMTMYDGRTNLSRLVVDEVRIPAHLVA